MRVGVVVRLRRDRGLYRSAPPASPPRRGRPRRHGSRFAFKEPQTWGPPDEVLEFEDERYGRGRLERWHRRHERKAPALVYDVVRARVHRERPNPPEAVWFASLPPGSAPASLPVTAYTLWSAYVQRWTVEPRAYPQNVRSQPRSAAEWRPNGTPLRSVPDYKRLSQREPGLDAPPLAASGARGHLTPPRVRQSLKAIFVRVGSPARGCQRRGKPLGWPKGKPRTPKPRYAVVKKGVARAQTA